MSIFSFLKSSSPAKDHAIARIDAKQFQTALASKSPTLIDVRTPSEFRQGNIASAKNIDFFNPSEFSAWANQQNKETPVYLYCRSGNRSLKAARQLAKMGFTELYDLRGGYSAWSAL